MMKMTHGPIVYKMLVPTGHRLRIEVDTEARSFRNTDSVARLAERSIFDDVPDLPAEQ